jgi:hypothetical protein
MKLLCFFNVYGMEAQDSCVALLGAGGVGNTPLIVKVANSPTWLSSDEAGTSHQFMEQKSVDLRGVVRVLIW